MIDIGVGRFDVRGEGKGGLWFSVKFLSLFRSGIVLIFGDFGRSLGFTDKGLIEVVHKFFYLPR